MEESFFRHSLKVQFQGQIKIIIMFWFFVKEFDSFIIVVDILV